MRKWFPHLHSISLSQGSCWKINTKLIPTQAQESPEPIYDLVDCGLKSLPPGVFSKCKVLRKEALLLQVFICIQFNLDNWNSFFKIIGFSHKNKTHSNVNKKNALEIELLLYEKALKMCKCCINVRFRNSDISNIWRSSLRWSKMMYE